jgi:hypothetical protein
VGREKVGRRVKEAEEAVVPEVPEKGGTVGMGTVVTAAMGGSVVLEGARVSVAATTTMALVMLVAGATTATTMRATTIR